jgi:hypothetical protein
MEETYHKSKKNKIFILQPRREYSPVASAGYETLFSQETVGIKHGFSFW